MTTNALAAQLRKSHVILLMALCCVQVAAVLSYAYFCSQNGYLPLPFIYDKHDTFMDFFNPAFWSTQDGCYTDWGAVYPPLNFVILKFLRWLFVGTEDFGNSFVLRREGGVLQILIVITYLAAPFFVISRNYWNRFTRLEKLLVCVVLIGSAPFLFALERGNLIILSFFLLPFIFSEAPVQRLMSIALLVNLKPYFCLLLLGYVLKKYRNEFIVAVALSGGLYLLTGVLLGSDPLAMPRNLLSFSGEDIPFSWREVFSMPSSVSAFSYLLSSDTFQNSRWSKFLMNPMLLGEMIKATQWMVFVFAGIALLRGRRTLPLNLVLATFLVMIPNSGISVGGYTLVFPFLLLPIFYEMRLRNVYFFLMVVMALPWDFLVLIHEAIPPQVSFFTDRRVDIEWMLGLGSFIRPVVDLALLATLAWELMLTHSKTAENIASSNAVAYPQVLENDYAG